VHIDAESFGDQPHPDLPLPHLPTGRAVVVKAARQRLIFLPRISYETKRHRVSLPEFSGMIPETVEYLLFLSLAARSMRNRGGGAVDAHTLFTGP